MSPRGKKREGKTVRSTVDLPEALWKSAKIRALEERKDLRAVIIEALEAYLKTKIKVK